MKKLLFILLFCPIIGLAQGGFKKGIREGDAYRIVTNDGIQFNFGATYQMTPKTTNYQSLITVVGAPKGFIDPQGKLGFFAEIGMAHFPKWKGLVPIKFLKKSRLMDYVDWGIGYKQFAGSEKTNIVQGNPSIMSEGTESFKNGFVYGRFSAHSLIYVGKKKIDVARKYFIDNAIGFNFDYNVLFGNKDYTYGSTWKNYKFHAPLVVQFHYSIGVGIRFNRAWMMIPGVYLPLIGLHEFNGINGRMNWFSSTYWPVQAQIKFIKLFERPPKCGVYGDPADKEKEKSFRMNY